MKTKTIELYEYSELSKEAQQKALDRWKEYNDDPFMQSHMINMLKEILDNRGIKYDTDSIDVRYSLSHSQGDGFMFLGTVIWKEQDIAITHTGQLSNHYCHAYTSEFETGELSSEDVDSFKAMYVEVCKEMEQIGYDHIEYQESEEMFIEICEANEYTFREDGTMENI